MVKRKRNITDSAARRHQSRHGQSGKFRRFGGRQRFFGIFYSVSVGRDDNLPPSGHNTRRLGLGSVDEYFIVGFRHQRQQHYRRYRRFQRSCTCLCDGPNDGYSDSNRNSDCYGYSNTDSDTNANIYADPDSYSNSDGDTNTDTESIAVSKSIAESGR